MQAYSAPCVYSYNHPLREIPWFHLISWCGNFVERHSFRIVSGESPKTMRKLCLATKFLHQKIRLNYSIFHSASYIRNLTIFWALAYLEPEAYLKPCKTLTRHIQNPAIGHYSAIFRHIQNLIKHLHTQRPGILGILEYSEAFHNCIPTHIKNLNIFTKIYEYSELWHI